MIKGCLVKVFFMKVKELVLVFMGDFSCIRIIFVIVKEIYMVLVCEVILEIKIDSRMLVNWVIEWSIKEIGFNVMICIWSKFICLWFWGVKWYLCSYVV